MIESIILFVAHTLGIDLEMLPVYLMVLVAIANLIGKSIPASATGVLGVVRKVALVIGLYVPQKITPGVTTKTVAKAIVADVPDAAIRHAAEQLPKVITTGVAAGTMARAIVEAADSTPAVGDIVPEEYRTDPFRRRAEAARDSQS